jgi:hypothetical protein
MAYCQKIKKKCAGVQTKEQQNEEKQKEKENTQKEERKNDKRTKRAKARNDASLSCFFASAYCFSSPCASSISPGTVRLISPASRASGVGWAAAADADAPMGKSVDTSATEALLRRELTVWRPTEGPLGLLWGTAEADDDDAATDAAAGTGSSNRRLPRRLPAAAVESADGSDEPS